MSFIGAVIQLHSVQNPGILIDVEAAGTGNGSKIHFWSPTGANNQKWTVAQRSDGKVALLPLHAPGMALDVGGNDVCHLWQRDDNNQNQGLIFQSSTTHPGAFVVVTAGGKVLDMDLSKGGNQSDKLHTWSPTNGLNQQFYINFVAPPAPAAPAVDPAVVQRLQGEMASLNQALAAETAAKNAAQAENASLKQALAVETAAKAAAQGQAAQLQSDVAALQQARGAETAAKDAALAQLAAAQNSSGAAQAKLNAAKAAAQALLAGLQ